MKSLNAMSLGKEARVKAISAEGAVHQRLMRLGLLPGRLLKVVQVAPLGDPISILFEGQKLSIRRSEAVGILVESS